MNRRFILSVGLLAGTIIGAGIFSLPYLFRELGVLVGILYMAVFAGVYYVIHFMYARLVETREREHQFFYFARTYFKKPFSTIASFIIIGELLFVLTVYLILAPTFSQIAFGEGGIIALLLFWFLGSAFMLAKLEWLGFAEILGTVSIIGIILTLLIVSWDLPFQVPLIGNMNIALFFLPFGPLLFSLAGRPAIAEVVQEHRKSQKEGKKFSLARAIRWGTAIPAIIYIVFIVSVLKLNPLVSAEALNSLPLSPLLLSLLGIMGLITLWTSYFIIGINVKDILREDMRVSPKISLGVAWGVPLLLYAIGFHSFLPALSFTGGVFLGLEGIFVIAMWQRAFPGSRWRKLSWWLYLPFVFAIVYEVLHFVV